MAPENRELARVASKNLQAMFDALAEDIVWSNVGTNAPADLTGTYRGKRAVTRIVERWVGTWSDYEFELEQTIGSGDAIAVGVAERGRGKGSGLPMERRYGMVWTFSDGRITHVAVYDDLEQARRALERGVEGEGAGTQR